MVEKPRDYHQFLDRDQAYGGIAANTVSVQVTNTALLGQNKFRKKVILINDSDTTIYVAKGTVAALNAGIRINPAGANFIDEPDALGYLYIGPYAAICAAANKNLLVIEEI